jgi:hypothetical protein
VRKHSKEISRNPMVKNNQNVSEKEEKYNLILNMSVFTEDLHHKK